MNIQEDEILEEQESDIFNDPNQQFDESQIQPKNLNINQVEELLGLEISKIENQYKIMYQQAVKDLENNFKNQNNGIKRCENCQNINKSKQKQKGKSYWQNYYDQEFQNKFKEYEQKYNEKLNEANRMKSLLSVRLKKLSDQKKLFDVNNIENYQIEIDQREKQIMNLQKENQNLQDRIKKEQNKNNTMQAKIEELEFIVQEFQLKQQNEKIIQQQIDKQKENQNMNELMEEKKVTDSDSDNDQILLLPIDQTQFESQNKKKKIKLRQQSSNYQKVLKKSSSQKQVKKQSNQSYLMQLQNDKNQTFQDFMHKERQKQLQNPLEQLFQGQIDTDDKKDIQMKTIRMQYTTQKYKDMIYEQDFFKQVLFVKKQLLDIFLNTEEDILKREELKQKIEDQINYLLKFWEDLQFPYYNRLDVFQKFQNLSSLDDIQSFLKKETQKIKQMQLKSKPLIKKLIDKNKLQQQLFSKAQEYSDFQVFYQKNIKKLQKLNKILKSCEKIDQSCQISQILQLQVLLNIEKWEIQYLEKLMIQQNVIQKIRNI